MFRFLVPVFALLIVMSSKPLNAQEFDLNSSGVRLSFSGEILSSYIWRGQNMGHTPSLQPTAELFWRGFSAGATGAFKIKGSGDNDINLFVAREFGSFSVELWDYCSFEKHKANHLIDALIRYTTGERHKLSFMVSSLIFGAETAANIYGEAQYTICSGKNEYSVFTGYQLNGNYYADTRAFVNAGVSYLRDITLFQKYDLALITSYIVNPAIKSSYLTFGIVL